jgi:spermidine synthase
MKSDLWVEEKVGDFLGIRYRVDKTHFSGKSEFQHVDVVETRGFGKMLLNDGLVMLTERDEFVYHDMIAHIPLFTHPSPKKVLVIGGGDGGTVREVLRHESIEKCVMVEIDNMVVEASRQFIPQTSKDLGHEKLELIIGDGVKFVAETKEKFDVILVDSTDPIGPAQPLFGIDFYRDIFNCLSDDGIVIGQGENFWYEKKMQSKLLEIMNQVFPVVSLYNYSNLCYPGSIWSFAYASKKYHPTKDFKPQRVQESGLEFDYYNEDIHSACFALPNFMKKELSHLFKG